MISAELRRQAGDIDKQIDILFARTVEDTKKSVLADVRKMVRAARDASQKGDNMKAIDLLTTARKYTKHAAGVEYPSAAVCVGEGMAEEMARAKLASEVFAELRNVGVGTCLAAGAGTRKSVSKLVFDVIEGINGIHPAEAAANAPAIANIRVALSGPDTEQKALRIRDALDVAIQGGNAARERAAKASGQRRTAFAAPDGVAVDEAGLVVHDRAMTIVLTEGVSYPDAVRRAEAEIKMRMASSGPGPERSALGGITRGLEVLARTVKPPPSRAASSPGQRRTAFAAPDGVAVDEARLAVHDRAMTIVAAEGISYQAAVSRAEAEGRNTA